MIRFIELGNQISLSDDIKDAEFAWWTTIRDEFIEFCGEQAWEKWSEFEWYFLEDLRSGKIPDSWDLERFWGLYPKYRKKREGITERSYIENRLIQGGNWEP